MKIAKAKSSRVLPLGMVNKGKECFVDGVKCVKLDSKTVMTHDGHVVRLTSATLVKVKL